MFSIKSESPHFAAAAAAALQMLVSGGNTKSTSAMLASWSVRGSFGAAILAYFHNALTEFFAVFCSNQFSLLLVVSPTCTWSAPKSTIFSAAAAAALLLFSNVSPSPRSLCAHRNAVTHNSHKSTVGLFMFIPLVNTWRCFSNNSFA